MIRRREPNKEYVVIEMSTKMYSQSRFMDQVHCDNFIVGDEPCGNYTVGGGAPMFSLYTYTTPEMLVELF